VHFSTTFQWVRKKPKHPSIFKHRQGNKPIRQTQTPTEGLWNNGNKQNQKRKNDKGAKNQFSV
jgi:hypothetical protein